MSSYAVKKIKQLKIKRYKMKKKSLALRYLNFCLKSVFFPVSICVDTHTHTFDFVHGISLLFVLLLLICLLYNMMVLNFLEYGSSL